MGRVIVGRQTGHLEFEHAGLHGPGAVEAPFRNHHFRNHAVFDAIGRLETVEVLLPKGGEGFVRLALEKDALGEQAVMEGVLGGTLFSFGGGRPVRFGAIGAGGLDFSFRWHYDTRVEGRDWVNGVG